MDAPALRYYETLIGAWSGVFALRVTSRRALLDSPAPLDMRYGLWSVSLVPGLASARMSTTLEPEGASGRAFLHTTRVSKVGITLFRTSEVITVQADGSTFELSGEQRSPGHRQTYEASGEIDDSGTRATYRIPWLGTSLLQRTRIVADGLELSQETAWSSARVLLVRRPAAP